MEKYEESCSAYEMALDLKDDDLMSNYGYAHSAWKQNKGMKAALYLKTVIALDKNYLSAYLDLGSLYEAMKMPIKAELTYFLSLETYPGDIHTHLHLAELYEKNGDFRKAREIYSKMTSLSPQNGFEYCTLGFAYRELDRYEEAIQCFEKATELDPDTGIPYYHLGACCLQIGKKEKSLKICETLRFIDTNLEKDLRELCKNW